MLLDQRGQLVTQVHEAAAENPSNFDSVVIALLSQNLRVQLARHKYSQIAPKARNASASLPTHSAGHPGGGEEQAKKSPDKNARASGGPGGAGGAGGMTGLRQHDKRAPRAGVPCRADIFMASAAPRTPRAPQAGPLSPGSEERRGFSVSPHAADGPCRPVETSSRLGKARRRH